MNITDPIKIEDESNGELNMEFQTEDYEHQYAAHSLCDDLLNAGSSLSVCGLCGTVGKLFINLKENEDLVSKINEYMPFIDMQNHFSDNICYSCSSQVNSWNGFYLNCSLVNSKLNKESVISTIENSNSNKKQKNTPSAASIDLISKSYNRLERNPCTENVARTMDVLTNCLKSLVKQLKTSSSNTARLCEVTELDDSNEENDSNFDTTGLIKPFDVIEVDIAESSIVSDPDKIKAKLRQVHQVHSHHGIIFCDDEGHAYRVNKKQPGKLYVRCADSKCPVRGSIVGSLFRSNRHEHTHPPRPMKNGRFLVSREEKVTTSCEAEMFS